MEKLIEIDILSDDDLFERYNQKEGSHDLIEYLIFSVFSLKKKDTLKNIINNKTKVECSN